MPTIVRDLGTLVPTSSGASVTTPLGHLDESASITIFVTSSANAATSWTLQVSQFDPADSFPITGVTESSNFFNYATTGASGGITASSGGTIVLNNISFRGLRLSSLTSANGGEIIAFVTKQISV